MKKMFPLLKASEIECRMAQVSKKGYSLLLYKTARTDMDILDEVVGPENWQCEYYDCAGQTFCRIGININYDKGDAAPCWVWKSDTGTPSNIEAQKGLASDARKRAGFAWGIGRELYTAPFIFIVDPDNVVADGSRYKLKPGFFPSFSVGTIRYDGEGNITGLELKDNTGAVCYVYGTGSMAARKERRDEKKKLAAKAEGNGMDELEIALCDVRNAQTKEALKAAHEQWRGVYGKYGSYPSDDYIRAVNVKTSELMASDK